MHLSGKVVIVTGAASVVVWDLDAGPIQAAAEELRGVAAVCDATDFAAVKRVVDETEARFGRVDLYCANAGVLVKGGLEVPDDAW